MDVVSSVLAAVAGLASAIKMIAHIIAWAYAWHERRTTQRGVISLSVEGVPESVCREYILYRKPLIEHARASLSSTALAEVAVLHALRQLVLAMKAGQPEPLSVYRWLAAAADEYIAETYRAMRDELPDDGTERQPGASTP